MCSIDYKTANWVLFASHPAQPTFSTGKWYSFACICICVTLPLYHFPTSTHTPYFPQIDIPRPLTLHPHVISVLHVIYVFLSKSSVNCSLFYAANSSQVIVLLGCLNPEFQLSHSFAPCSLVCQHPLAVSWVQHTPPGPGQVLARSVKYLGMVLDSSISCRVMSVVQCQGMLGLFAVAAQVVPLGMFYTCPRQLWYGHQKVCLPWDRLKKRTLSQGGCLRRCSPGPGGMQDDNNDQCLPVRLGHSLGGRSVQGYWVLHSRGGMWNSLRWS